MAYPFARRGRLPLRERLKNNVDSMRETAGPIDPNDPRSAAHEEMCRRFEAAIPPKRNLVKRPVDGKPAVPYEKEVLKDCLEALRKDPRVVILERSQSGVFLDGDRYIRVGTPGKLDITFMLVGGRYGEIECKRPGLKPDERQQQRIEAIRSGGGIAGCAHSGAEALELLP